LLRRKRFLCALIARDTWYRLSVADVPEDGPDEPLSDKLTNVPERI